LSGRELLIERQGAVTTITFNRPDQRNALTLDMLEGVRRFFAEIGDDNVTRVVVLRGAGGKAFSAGSDFTDLRLIQDRGIVPSTADDPFDLALRALLACPLPVIALIEGFAVGGGCALAVGCDIRIAGESTRLGMPPAKLGLIYNEVELQPFVDLLGPGRTKLLFYSGRIFDAPTALSFGLVDEVVPDDQVVAHTYTLVGEIAANAPLSVRNTKRVLGHLTRRPLDPAIRAEIGELVRQTQASADFQEGQRAVAEKRRPRFEGR
jgi:enoyl-CoA hydratase